MHRKKREKKKDFFLIYSLRFYNPCAANITFGRCTFGAGTVNVHGSYKVRGMAYDVCTDSSNR